MKLDLNPIKAGIAVVALLTALNNSDAIGDEYTKRWGPPLGESVPVLEAYDHTGTDSPYQPALQTVCTKSSKSMRSIMFTCFLDL